MTTAGAGIMPAGIWDNARLFWNAASDGTGILSAWSAGDIATTLANSSIYLEAAGHVVVAWMWLEQLIAASDHEGDFYDGKRAAAQYFYAYELPKVGPQFDLLASLDRTTVDAQASWF